MEEDVVGDMQMQMVEPVGGGRHEFTQEERERGQHTRASRARRRRILAQRRFKEWARRDAQLWRDLQTALAFGTKRQVGTARVAWTEHQISMPVDGRRA